MNADFLTKGLQRIKYEENRRRVQGWWRRIQFSNYTLKTTYSRSLSVQCYLREGELMWSNDSCDWTSSHVVVCWNSRRQVRTHHLHFYFKCLLSHTLSCSSRPVSHLKSETGLVILFCYIIVRCSLNLLILPLSCVESIFVYSIPFWLTHMILQVRNHVDTCLYDKSTWQTSSTTVANSICYQNHYSCLIIHYYR